MKKILIACFITLFSCTAFAGTVKDNCGCGLGTMALGEEEGLVSHVVAAWLNAFCGNQTFGVTSGTLGCDQSTAIVSNERLNTYVADHMDTLAADMAFGEGESLDALTDLMQVPASQKTDVQLKLQSNFDKIFATGDESPEQVVANITAVM